MNRTALIALIKNLKNNGFTSSVEKLLAIVLAFIDTEDVPLQQCEIIDILDINKQHCRDTLDGFVETKLLKSFVSGKRATFYKPLRL